MGSTTELNGNENGKAGTVESLVNSVLNVPRSLGKQDSMDNNISDRSGESSDNAPIAPAQDKASDDGYDDFKGA